MTYLGSTALISLLTLAAPGAGRPSPETVLGQRAAGADALDIVMREPSRDPRGDAPPTDKTLLTIKGAEAIAELLGLVRTTAVEENPLTWHTPPTERGGQFIRLRRGTREVAAFTFKSRCFGRSCASVMEPYTGRLWIGGDAVLADASAQAMTAWFHRHGWKGFDNPQAPPPPAVPPPPTPPPPAMPPPAGSTPGDVALHDGVLYAVGKGRKVRRASLSQARPSVLVEVSGDDLTRLNGVAAARAGVAFIVQDGDGSGRVMTAAHDGSRLRTLWAGAGSPWDLAFHGGEVVWTNREAGTVCKAPFVGGKVTVLAQLDHPAQLAIAGDDAFVAVWSAANVVRIPLAGGAPLVIASVPDGAPQGITVQGQEVFFGVHHVGEVRKVPRAGGPVATVASYPGCATVDVAVTATRIHFICFGGSVISVNRRPGSAPEDVTPGQGAVSALVLGPDALFGYSALEDRIHRIPR